MASNATDGWDDELESPIPFNKYLLLHRRMHLKWLASDRHWSPWKLHRFRYRSRSRSRNDGNLKRSKRDQRFKGRGCQG